MDPSGGGQILTTWGRVRIFVIMFAVLSGSIGSLSALGWRGHHLVVSLSLLGTISGWLVWMWMPRPGRRAWVGLLLWLAAGVILAVIQPHGSALALPSIALLSAAVVFPWRTAVALFLGTTTIYLAGVLIADISRWLLLIGPLAFGLATLAGRVRRQRVELAAQQALSREEQARVAALDERARIAREIHDVLAHALAALTVQLETADALLESNRPVQARESVVRAGRLAREGLAETRRAIGALRGDTLPLPALFDALADGYRSDFKAPMTVRVSGQPGALSADTSLALYRTAQEAITNVRKHAPGAPVEIDLRYTPEDVDLTIANGAPPPGADRPLAGAGGGYGLTGLRERAKLAGGTFDAGPTSGGYRVDVRIPV
jgi:signal transduction histidine kinase